MTPEGCAISTNEAFPLEIYDLILWHLELESHDRKAEDARNEGSTLAKCLLVSKTFCHISRRILFKSIRLSSARMKNRDFKERVSTLVDIMSPKIGQGILSYIHSFIFHSSVYKFFDHPETPAIQILNDESFITMMTLFRGPDSNLQEFMAWTFPRVDWNCLSADFHREFRLLCRSLHLTTLDMSGFYNLPQLFFHGTHLKTLRLFQVPHLEPRPLLTSTPPTLLEEEFSCTPPYLRCLDTNYSIPDDLYPITSLSFLKVLASRMDQPERMNWTWTLLQNCQKSIEDLTLNLKGTITGYFIIEHISLLNYPGTWPMPIALFDFGLLSNLSSLNIEHDLLLLGSTTLDGPEVALNQIAGLLKFPTPLHFLRSVGVKFYVDVMQPIHGLTYVTSLITSANWLLVDEALSHDRFHALKDATISLEVDTSHKGGFGTLADEAQGLLRQKFPSLSSSKAIKSTFKVELRSFCSQHDA
ncbi:hypothetical protein NLJ89_g922 [Agrocybe chaxingu]|uniref:Uncharacterized protein n=1 Tax=Agrocybe chaxingu TaxID=84603 RepID=A0A9W8N0W3_9AGAR|nr:hypothetical protein NLJ89_g922 [Agrocybe chaxingu]